MKRQLAILPLSGGWANHIFIGVDRIKTLAIKIWLILPNSIKHDEMEHVWTSIEWMRNKEKMKNKHINDLFSQKRQQRHVGKRWQKWRKSCLRGILNECGQGGWRRVFALKWVFCVKMEKCEKCKTKHFWEKTGHFAQVALPPQHQRQDEKRQLLAKSGCPGVLGAWRPSCYNLLQNGHLCYSDSCATTNSIKLI